MSSKGEEAGKFLRNLDMARGRRISAGYARDRHVCETIHRAMKRWMAFDVRGLRKESEEARKKFKFFTAQILCAVFDPYYQPDARDRIWMKGGRAPFNATISEHSAERNSTQGDFTLLPRSPSVRRDGISAFRTIFLRQNGPRGCSHMYPARSSE